MMHVVCCTKKNVHLFNGLNPYADQARLRYDAFRPLNWDVAYFDNAKWEEDEYDISPNTEYLVCYDDDDKALGSSRLVQTDETFCLGNQQKIFMLKDVFSGRAGCSKKLVDEKALDSGEHVIEGTRFALSKSLSRDEAQYVISHLAVANVQRCLDRGINTIVGIMAPGIWRSVWGKRGCQPNWLGNEVDLGVDGVIRAGRLEVSYEALAHIQAKTGIYDLEIDTGAEMTSISIYSIADEIPVAVNS